MIGFDRPLRPRWIYESLLLATPDQKLIELNVPFESIAFELTGKEGKRKARTVLFRCFLRSENSRARVRKDLVLKNLSSEYGPEFMKPIYLFYLIGKTETLFKISEHIFRLYDFGEEFDIQFLKKKMIDELGERDVVGRAARSFIQTLDYFGIAGKNGNKATLKKRLPVNDEQFRIMLELYSREILQSPQISLNHLPRSIFNYFEIPNLKTIAQKYNGEYWDYQHRIKDDFLMIYQI
ncbi:hypothetical protein [Methanosarcina sp.]|uniref:hypothetical protein n=1 Tax=Methanosarcina sp. TaxID=2213 RepID=UPI002BE36129|nr:hypothetical protein [Methanosarcina sp.]HOW14996.1 hypothetical protein [Methanosarcina sp.]